VGLKKALKDRDQLSQRKITLLLLEAQQPKNSFTKVRFLLKRFAQGLLNVSFCLSYLFYELLLPVKLLTNVITFPPVTIRGSFSLLEKYLKQLLYYENQQYYGKDCAIDNDR